MNSAEIYFEDLAIGHAFRSTPRRLTAEDIDAFAALTGDVNSIHMDDADARAAGFPARVAHGALIFSLSMGLDSEIDRWASAVLLSSRRSYQEPVMVGDVIRLEAEIRELRRSRSRPGWGIATTTIRVVKEDGGAAQEGEDVGMLRCREP